jgi:hypothetical protein
MISAIANRDKLAFMLFGQKIKALVLIRFMKCLMRHNRTLPQTTRTMTVFFVGELAVNASSSVANWGDGHWQQIRLFLRHSLHGYSPDFNDD